MGQPPSYILLVEDSPDDAELTVRALAEANLANEVVIARDGAEAIDILFAQGAHAGRDMTDTPALVLLDFRLPKINGLEVIGRLRGDERTRFIPVLIMTSSSEDEDMFRGHGAGNFVRKPVTFGAFATAASLAGLHWMVVKDPRPEIDIPGTVRAELRGQ